MKYGIEQEGLLTKCANCKKTISADGSLNVDFCEKCGAPLSVLAISQFEQFRADEREQLLNYIKNVAVKNNTDSFAEILKIMAKDAK